MKRHWADRPLLRGWFWFLVLPHRLKSYLSTRCAARQILHTENA